MAGRMEFEEKITPVVIINCMAAATGGLMFGYDIGVSGGVTSMDDFLKKFFPVGYRRMQEPGLNSNYCKYDNQWLQFFTSSLCLAGSIATFFASYTTRKLGRRITMLIGGLFAIIGAVLSAAAQHLAMLLVGRILLGCGVGFANQAVPLFLSEIAPTRIRGRLNILFQLNITVGILFANLVNYGTAKRGWGWRVSLGLGGIPGGLLTLSALLVFDTPNSLIERGYLEEGKIVLRRIRGTDNIEHEFMELFGTSRVANEVKHPFRNLLMRNRPQLIIAMALQIFQQLAGINLNVFYAPILFISSEFGKNAGLYSIVITGAINALSTLVSLYLVDKVGRRVLLLQGGIQMFLSQVIIAVILGIKLKDDWNNLNLDYAIFIVTMIFTFVSAFAWSWGPLGWLIPSEIFPLEARSIGQSVAVCVNLSFTLVIGQTFLPMLCHFKFGVFLFSCCWILVMLFFVIFLLPETKNVPIERMTKRVWKRHWLWKRFTYE